MERYIMLEWETFLSTPSAGRATDYYFPQFANLGISIHALRGEGDLVVSFITRIAPKFLSTPSAGRATAKTEKNISAYVSL